jgi:hypothetical protein
MANENEVTLTSGVTVPRAVAETFFMTLKALERRGHLLAIRTLLRLSRDRSHRPYGDTGQTLHDSGLLESWDPATKQGSVQPALIPIVKVAVAEVHGGLRIAAHLKDILK